MTYIKTQDENERQYKNRKKKTRKKLKTSINSFTKFFD